MSDQIATTTHECEAFSVRLLSPKTPWQSLQLGWCFIVDFTGLYWQFLEHITIDQSPMNQGRYVQSATLKRLATDVAITPALRHLMAGAKSYKVCCTVRPKSGEHWAPVSGAFGSGAAAPAGMLTRPSVHTLEDRLDIKSEDWARL